MAIVLGSAEAYLVTVMTVTILLRFLCKLEVSFKILNPELF